MTARAAKQTPPTPPSPPTPAPTPRTPAPPPGPSSPRPPAGPKTPAGERRAIDDPVQLAIAAGIMRRALERQALAETTERAA